MRGVLGCASQFFAMATSIIETSRLERMEFSNDEIARYSRHLIMPE
jgi:adenylyltransferase/sulfurtransferase